MKKTWIIRALLLIAYCVPFAFLSVNGDATSGTMLFYGVMIAGFALLCWGALKTNNFAVLYIGNVLSFASSYRRSLKDILPRGTHIHPTEAGDFQWEVIFHFDNVVLNDGSIGSGGMLRIQSWYGELDIHFDGEILACNTDEQETWEKEVLDAIQ